MHKEDTDNMKLYENGAYLINGKDVVIHSPEAEEAVKSGRMNDMMSVEILIVSVL